MRRPFLILAVAALLAAVFLARELPAQAAKQPTVAWTPQIVELDVPNDGTPVVHEVRFVPSAAIPAASIRVVPALEPFIDVVPDSFDGLAAGVPVVLTITATAPPGTPLETHDGVIQLRNESGKKKVTIAKPLPVVLHIGEPIGVDGGTATSADGSVVVTVPPGTVDESVVFTIEPSSDGPPPDLGVPAAPTVDLGPSGVAFNKLVDVAFHYDPSQFPLGVNEEHLQIVFETEFGWQATPTDVDAVLNIASAPAWHFTRFALVDYAGGGIYDWALRLTQGIESVEVDVSTELAPSEGEDVNLLYVCPDGQFQVGRVVNWDSPVVFDYCSGGRPLSVDVFGSLEPGELSGRRIALLAPQELRILKPELYSVFPDSGPPGTTFTAFGEGFKQTVDEPAYTSTLYLQPPDGSIAPSTQTTTNSGIGDFSHPIDSSGFEPGTWLVWAVDDTTSATSNVATFEVTAPTVTVEPQSGLPGTVFDVDGSGFTRFNGYLYGTITSHLQRPNGTEFQPLTLEADAAGSYMYTIDSTGFEPGTWTTWADDDLTGAESNRATFEVIQAQVPTGYVVGWGGSGIPAPPAGLSGVTSIAANHENILALKADGTLVAWGYSDFGQTSPPSGLTGVTRIAVGGHHSLALKEDGTVVGWGWDDFGQATPPEGLSGVTDIVAAYAHSLALKEDGTVVGWGFDESGQATPPDGLTGVVALAASQLHSLALKADGTVVGWGFNRFGEATPPDEVENVVAIAAVDGHSLALKDDGTVVHWGNPFHGGNPPDGLDGVIDIALSVERSAALRADGTVVGWGDRTDSIPPADLSGVIDIAVGDYHSLALKADGTVVGWGWDAWGQATPPVGLGGVFSIVAAGNHSLALVSDSGENTSP